MKFMYIQCVSAKICSYGNTRVNLICLLSKEKKLMNIEFFKLHEAI